MRRLLPAILLSTCGLLTLAGCDSEPPVARIIVVDQKVGLRDWPDSAYIANLDSVLAAEPVKHPDTVSTSIRLSAKKMDISKFPSMNAFKNNAAVSGKKEVKQEKETSDKNAAKQQALNQKKNPKEKEQTKPVEKKPTADKSKEDFATRFSNALTRLQSDPFNGSLYKTLTAKDGDDLFKLLKRAYGSGVSTLPRFYVMSGIKSVNRGVNLDQLNEGDKVKVPKL